MIRAPRADELDAVAALVASLQSRPEDRNAFFGETSEEAAGLLSSWETSWAETSLVAERDDRLVGFLGAELDRSATRVWLHGPVVADAAWDEIADALLSELLARVSGVASKEQELAADSANARVAAFAARHGFVAGFVHYLLELPAAQFDALPAASAPPLDDAQSNAFAHLHDELFPGTYYSAQQLLDQAERGDAVVLGLVERDKLAGYAAGRIDEAGNGYIDFVGVAEAHRRRGHGGALVAALTRALAARKPIEKVSLTVSTANPPALALYDRLGFVRAASAVGYRRAADGSA